MSPDSHQHDIIQQFTLRLHELQAAQLQLQTMLERLLLVQERSLDTQSRLLDSQAQLLEESRQLQAYLKEAQAQQRWNEQQDETNLLLLEELRELKNSLRAGRQLLPEHLAERLQALEDFMNGQRGPAR